jgi:hypothetical protein
MNVVLIRRAALVVVALAAVAGAVTGREKPSVELVEPKAARVQPARVEAAPLAEIDLDKLRRPEAAAPQNDPFARLSFAPAPAPAPQQKQAEAAPPAPTAPALPFKYFGKLTQNGKTEVYVMRGDELLAVAPGENIDNDYSVESISDSAIGFTYLPLKTRQNLELPG